jgi:F-type H+-transporting ATPase subunit gamma
MANLRQIRRRIKSVENTAKITRAFEMIAASKMRRAQHRVLAGRPYAEKMRDVLADLAAQPRGKETEQPLLEYRDVERIGIVHITPDRGMCGGLNTNLNQAAGKFLVETEAPVTLITVGRKGRDFMVRYRRDVQAVFTDLGDSPGLQEVLPIAHLVIQDYAARRIDRVYLSYARFINTAVQRPVMEQLLPVEPAPLEASQAVGYIYEPSSAEVLGALLPRFVEMEIYHAVLEAIASEQSARMVAMHSATDNAHDMLEDLTLLKNKVRQSAITTELLDIVGGAAALEG